MMILRATKNENGGGRNQRRAGSFRTYWKESVKVDGFQRPEDVPTEPAQEKHKSKTVHAGTSPPA